MDFKKAILVILSITFSSAIWAQDYSPQDQLARDLVGMEGMPLADYFGDQADGGAGQVASSYSGPEGSYTSISSGLYVTQWHPEGFYRYLLRGKVLHDNPDMSKDDADKYITDKIKNDKDYRGQTFSTYMSNRYPNRTREDIENTRVMNSFKNPKTAVENVPRQLATPFYNAVMDKTKDDLTELLQKFNQGLAKAKVDPQFDLVKFDEELTALRKEMENNIKTRTGRYVDLTKETKNLFERVEEQAKHPEKEYDAKNAAAFTVFKESLNSGLSNFTIGSLEKELKEYLVKCEVERGERAKLNCTEGPNSLFLQKAVSTINKTILQEKVEEEQAAMEQEFDNYVLEYGQKQTQESDPTLDAIKEKRASASNIRPSEQKEEVAQNKKGPPLGGNKMGPPPGGMVSDLENKNNAEAPLLQLNLAEMPADSLVVPNPELPPVDSLAVPNPELPPVDSLAVPKADLTAIDTNKVNSGGMPETAVQTLNLSSATEVIPSEKVTAPEEVVTAPEEVVTAPEEVVTAPEEETTPEEVVQKAGMLDQQQTLEEQRKQKEAADAALAQKNEEEQEKVAAEQETKVAEDIPAQTDDKLNACLTAMQELFKSADISQETIQEILKLQGQITLHRLAWANLRLASDDGKAVTSLEGTIDKLLAEQNSVPSENATPEEIEKAAALKYFKEAPLSRKGLARVLPYMSDILNAQVNEEEGKEAYLIGHADLKMLSLLSELEEEGNKGLLLADHSKDESVLNFTKIINSSYRTAFAGAGNDAAKIKKTKEANVKLLKNKLKSLTTSLNEQLSKIEAPAVCRDLVAGKECPTEESNQLTLDKMLSLSENSDEILDVIYQGISSKSKEDRYKGLRYNDERTWLRVKKAEE